MKAILPVHLAKQKVSHMHDQRFFDQTLAMIESGSLAAALPMLAGHLHYAHADALSWPDVRANLRRHPLHELLREDPFVAYSVRRPRGYPGDAGLIDIIYDRSVDHPLSGIAQDMFSITIGFQAAEAVRLRRAHAETMLGSAWQAGQRILVLACGHFREADALTGSDLSRITVVDQDAISLDRVRDRHGDQITIHEANVFRYLRSAATRGERFDLVYTLGLTDYLDVRAMELLHRLVKSVLAPGGTFTLANFLPHHLGTGWMDAVMDWQLIYRDERELVGYAEDVGLTPRTWRDATDSVVWCEMHRDR